MVAVQPVQIPDPLKVVALPSCTVPEPAVKRSPVAGFGVATTMSVAVAVEVDPIPSVAVAVNVVGAVIPPAPVVLQVNVAGEVEAVAGKQFQPAETTAAEVPTKLKLSARPVPPLPAVPLVTTDGPVKLLMLGRLTFTVWEICCC